MLDVKRHIENGPNKQLKKDQMYICSALQRTLEQWDMTYYSPVTILYSTARNFASSVVVQGRSCRKR